MKKTIIVCLIVFLCGSCSSKKQVSLSLLQAISIINQQHETIRSAPIPEAFQTSYGSQTYMQAFQYVMSHRQKTNGEDIIESQEAMEDCEDLFMVMQSLYGAYPLYKEEIEEAKTGIAHILSNQSQITKSELGELLRSKLSFLMDAHMQIDFTPLAAYASYYIEDLVSGFIKKDDRYYFADEQQPIVSIQKDPNIENYVKPQLESDGSVMFHLYIASVEDIAAISVELKDGRVLQIPMRKVETEEISKYVIVSKTLEGIPYMRVKKMVYRESEEEEKQAKQFLDAAEAFSKEDIAILDLRGNTGGNAIMSYMWAYAYAKQKVNGYGTRILRLPFNSDDMQIIDAYTSESMMQLKEYADYEPLSEYVYVSKGDEDTKLIENDTLLFVLQDENTASAAEMLIDLLHRVENVVFVGMPTAGFLQSSSMTSFYLENSGLQVRFGMMYGAFDETYGKEYTGLQPDIWVESSKALDHVLSLLSAGE